jgi:predicted PurR-regulated permease PerM
VDPQLDPPLERRRFSRVQVLEGVAAAILSTAIVSTAAGVGWLVIARPSEIKQIKTQIQQIVNNQNTFSDRFMDLEKQVNEHDRRIIRLEVK